MTANSNKGSFQPDSDVHITYEDQQRINEFARHNAKNEDLKEALKNKQNELRNLEDAVEELELMDEESADIPYLVGEVFLFQDLETTLKALRDTKEKILDEIKDIQKKNSQLIEEMMDLKTQLYAKFGNHINLEPDDD